MEKNLEYYLHLPYTRELTPQKSGVWVARIAQLPDCVSQGNSAEEALRNIEAVMYGWIKCKIEAGEAIPEPDENFPVASPTLDQIDLYKIDAALDAMETARAISMDTLEKLVHSKPYAPRTTTAASYLQIGEGLLSQAEVDLRHALESQAGENRGVLYADLGYLHLIQGRYDQAEKALSAALLEDDGEAYLRVAFWLEGALLPDYCPHPTRYNKIYLAAFANLAALHLAQNDIRRAGEVLKTMQVYEQEDLLTLEVWGCLAHAQGKYSKAREVWKHALRMAPDPREQKMLSDWLEKV